VTHAEEDAELAKVGGAVLVELWRAPLGVGDQQLERCVAPVHRRPAHGNQQRIGAPGGNGGIELSDQDALHDAGAGQRNEQVVARDGRTRRTRRTCLSGGETQPRAQPIGGDGDDDRWRGGRDRCKSGRERPVLETTGCVSREGAGDCDSQLAGRLS
jgi:hypothetical protein